MNKWKQYGLVLSLALLVTAVAADVCAAEGAHGGYRWGDFGWRVINVMVFAGILWFFVGALAKAFFRKRRQDIKDGLDSVEARRSTAKDQLADVEKRIANLEAERKAILDESRAQAESLKQGIVAEAHRQAEQIVQQARLTAENEGRAVMAEVRATLADEIVNAAEKNLREKLDTAQHERLIEKSLNKVVLH